MLKLNSLRDYDPVFVLLYVTASRPPLFSHCCLCFSRPSSTSAELLSAIPVDSFWVEAPTSATSHPEASNTLLLVSRPRGPPPLLRCPGVSASVRKKHTHPIIEPAHQLICGPALTADWLVQVSIKRCIYRSKS